MMLVTSTVVSVALLSVSEQTTAPKVRTFLWLIYGELTGTRSRDLYEVSSAGISELLQRVIDLVPR